MATTTPPIPSAAITQRSVAVTPFTATGPSKSDIDAAAKSSHNWFVAGVWWILGSAIVTAVLAYLAWKASDKQNALVIAAANARISETDTKAAKANERAGTLEKDNLTLRVKVATLEKAATDSAKALNGVRIDLSEQQQRTAEAEARTEELRRQNLATESRLERERRSRIELELSLKPRTLQFLYPNKRLEQFAGTSAEVFFPSNDPEAEALARNIANALNQTGWKVVVKETETSPPKGISVFDATETAAAELEEYLTASLLETVLRPWPTKAFGDGSSGVVRVVVGQKPTPYFDERIMVEATDGEWPYDEASMKFKDSARSNDLERMWRLRREWFVAKKK